MWGIQIVYSDWEAQADGNTPRLNWVGERRIFATLVGTDTASSRYESVFTQLVQVAIDQGFDPPDTPSRIRPNQLPLEGWTLEQTGPRGNEADFLLAITAPGVPSISPIPCKRAIDGPLFAVVVMDSFFTVSREDRRDVSEYQDIESVVNSFRLFLETIPHH